MKSSLSVACMQPSLQPLAQPALGEWFQGGGLWGDRDLGHLFSFSVSPTPHLYQDSMKEGFAQWIYISANLY